MSPKAVAKARIYTAFAGILSLVLVVAGYLLGFSPLWDAASESNASADDQEARNDSEQRQVNALRVQFGQIEDYRELLKELRIQVPTTLDHQEFQRQLAAIADDNKVQVNLLEFGTSQQVKITKGEFDVAALPIAAEAYGAQSSTSTGSDDDDDDDEQDSSGSAAERAEAKKEAEAEAKKPKFTNFYTVPVTIELQGEYADTVRAIRALQTSKKRIFLVTKLNGAAQTERGRSSDDSAEFVVLIEGQLSVFLDPEAAKSQPDSENIERGELPSTGLDRNPLTGS